MNLLFSFGNYIRPTRGGTERVTSLIANGLRARGHRVFFLITEENIPGNLPQGHYSCAGLSPEAKASFTRNLCRELGVNVIINEAGTSDDIWFLNRKCMDTACRIITCIHFDITGDLQYFYRTHCLTENKILRWLKLPLLKWMHTRSRRKRYRYLLQQSDAVIVPSPALVEQFFRFTGLNPSTTLRCIPNPALFAPETVQHKEKLAIFVGRLVPGKHPEHLLAAWRDSGAEKEGWQLVIAGDGALRPQLEAQLRKLRLHSVRFMGAVQDPASLYRQATLLLLPSDYESFSMVLLEGLSFACFPIVYSFPALSLLLARPEWGIALQQHSAKAMAKAIRHAISSNLSNLANQQDIHRHLRRFALPNILNQWEQLLRQISS